MNILCVIPARRGSKGLKNKNIKPILGKPLIGYTIEAALESKLCNKVVVSTDDKKIAMVTNNYRVQIIRRPAKYSTDSAPIEWALIHAVRYLEKNEKYIPDIVVWLQANVPIRKSGGIDRIVQKLIETNADSVITIVEVTRRPEYMMRMIEGNRIVFLEKTKEIRRQEFTYPLYIPDGAVLAMRKNVLVNSEGKKGAYVYLGEDIRGVIQEAKYAVEVDTEFDLKVVEGLLLGEQKNG